MRLGAGDLRHTFSHETLQKGAELCARGCVRQMDVATGGGHISASVLGSRPKPYSQTILISPTRSGWRIRGYCSCPMGTNCKHVAAVLLKYVKGDELDREDLDDPRPAVGARSAALLPAPQATRTASPTPAPAPGLRLSSSVSQWLDRLAAVTERSAEAKRPTSSNQRVLRYVLNHQDAHPTTLSRQVWVRPLSARMRKDGTLTDGRFYDPALVMRPREQVARFVTEADLDILRDLNWLHRTNGTPGYRDVPLEPGPLSRRVFAALLQSRRLHNRELNGRTLEEGPSERAEPQWISAARGEQRLTFVAGGGRSFDDILPLDPPHYVDLEKGIAGVIETDLPHAFAVEVARAPAVAPSEAAIVKETMRQRLAKGGKSDAPAPSGEADGVDDAASMLPLPEAPDNIETRIVTPVPRLDLFALHLRVKPHLAWYLQEVRHEGAFLLPLARLSFNYGGDTVHSASPEQIIERIEGDRVILTPRDAKAEGAALSRLTDLGFRALNNMPFDAPPDHTGDLFLTPSQVSSPYELLQTCDDPSRFLAFGSETVPELVRDGWEVVMSDDYPYRIAEGTAEWWADLGEGSGIDWFSFELGIAFEGHRVNLVPQLAEMLGRLPPEVTTLALEPGKHDAFVKMLDGLRLYHTLPDGRLLPLPADRLAPILRSLLELIGPREARLHDGKVRLHRAEAGALAAFADGMEDVAWAASTERLIDLGNRLRSGRILRRAAVKPPRTFKAKLRAYQSDGLSWLDFLREAGFGGVLADDMGLGKTVQALAFLAREKTQGRLDKPALIVSPTSVLPNWQAEAERFAPSLSVLALHGVGRKELFGQIAKHDLVLTTYPLLARDQETLLAHEFHSAILDEAQAIKNPKAAVSAIAHRVNARHRLALTGTPLENNLGEVWSLFEFLSPGLLGDERTFRRIFRTPIEKHGDAAAQTFLSSRLKPFMLRRTKEAVAKELPPKTEIVERVRLEGAQRDLYETVRSLMHARVRDEIAKKGLAKSHIIFLDALLKLRQVCCDPRLLKMPRAQKVKGSAKLERLMEIVPELVGEGRRILLFSQFTSMLALIEAELRASKIPYVQLTGDTTDRATPVRAFQSGKVPVFLLSLKAGGTGLNLTAADTVIHYDPWWNPAVEAQATDRAYRIGQDKPVFVYKLIVEEGIEEAIEQLKARKAALAEALFAGSAKKPLDLTEADISALFAPLASDAQRKAA